MRALLVLLCGASLGFALSVVGAPPAFSVDAHPMRLAHDRLLHSSIDLDAVGYGEGAVLAIDPYDGSAWVAAEAALVLHFDTAGTLISGTSLRHNVDALAASLDGTIWVHAGGDLVHLSSAATELASYADVQA